MNKENCFVPRPDASKSTATGSVNIVNKPKKVKKPADKMTKITNAIIIVLSAILVIIISMTISSIKEMDNLYYDTPGTFGSYARNESFITLASSVRSNRAKGYTESTDKDYIPYYAIGDYFYCASVYPIYEAKGYTDRISELNDRMIEYRVKMGGFDLYADQIDEMFGID